MNSHLVYPSRITVSTFLFVTLIAVSPASAETIEGFRDLKFGMTEKEVSSLEPCPSSSECLYELLGKNRYLHPIYRISGPDGSLSATADGQNPPRLARITIDMGKFSDSFYGELQNMLLDSYTLSLDITEEDINAFLNEGSSELVLEYENGQVLLKVVRRKFGNMVLKVVYQSGRMAAESKKESGSQK